jgi:hypothetical protein
MKSHTKRILRIRRLALAGCIVAVVAPASASAMYVDGGGLRPEVTVQQQQKSFTLPSGFRSEVQTTSPQSTALKPIALHRSAAPTAASEPNPSVIRVESVTEESSNTLWIVLASAAIAIALGSVAYATIRVTRLQHRELGSH